MSGHFTFHDDAFLVLPLVCLHHVECECCGESHGFAVSFGWIFWEVTVVFGGNDEHIG